MTKEISVVAHGATNAENAFEHGSSRFGRALLSLVALTIGAVRERAHRRAEEKHRRQTEQYLNNLPAETRRDINWPARRSEIFPDESQKIRW